MSGLGQWRNRWPNYIDPQNLFTAWGLFKEQLHVTHTKNTLLLSGSVRVRKETRCSLTCIRSAIKLKAQRSTVSLQPRMYLHYFTFLWKNSHYRTIDFIWNLFLRSSLKAKAKVGRSGCISFNISIHIISQWHSYTLPCLPPPKHGSELNRRICPHWQLLSTISAWNQVWLNTHHYQSHKIIPTYYYTENLTSWSHYVKEISESSILSYSSTNNFLFSM